MSSGLTQFGEVPLHPRIFLVRIMTTMENLQGASDDYRC